MVHFLGCIHLWKQDLTYDNGRESPVPSPLYWQERSPALLPQAPQPRVKPLVADSLRRTSGSTRTAFKSSVEMAWQVTYVD